MLLRMAAPHESSCLFWPLLFSYSQNIPCAFSHYWTCHMYTPDVFNVSSPIEKLAFMCHLSGLHHLSVPAMYRTFPGRDHRSSMPGPHKRGGTTAPAREETDQLSASVWSENGAPDHRGVWVEKSPHPGLYVFLQNPENSGDTVGHSIIITCLQLKRVMLISVFPDKVFFFALTHGGQNVCT